MSIRPTQGRIFDLVQLGIRRNTSDLIRAQEQASSGKRIVRASDDAVGSSISLSLRRQVGAIDSFVASTDAAQPRVSQASARLQEGADVISEIRSLFIQGMNGALNERDRESIANRIELLEGQMLDIANTRNGDTYLFAGTDTATEPFTETTIDGERRIVYRGNEERHRILVGRDSEVPLNVTGSEVFERYDYSGTRMGDSTGAAVGTTPDGGSGYGTLIVRQAGTTGTMGQGITLVGSGDTVIGDRALVVDAANNTVTMGGGVPEAIPTPLPSNFSVADENGSILHLDMTGWSGADFSTTITGAAELSIDGTNFTPADLTEENLRLTNEATGMVIHVNTTEIVRAGQELVTLEGTASLFDTIRGGLADLRLSDDVSRQVILERLQSRLSELDRSQDDLLVGLGKLGAASNRMEIASSRLADLNITVEGLISNVEDADFAEVALDLQRSEQTLQLAQATGARLLQQSLLNYL